MCMIKQNHMPQKQSDNQEKISIVAEIAVISKEYSLARALAPKRESIIIVKIKSDMDFFIISLRNL